MLCRRCWRGCCVLTLAAPVHAAGRRHTDPRRTAEPAPHCPSPPPDRFGCPTPSRTYALTAMSRWCWNDDRRLHRASRAAAHQNRHRPAGTLIGQRVTNQLTRGYADRRGSRRIMLVVLPSVDTAGPTPRRATGRHLLDHTVIMAIAGSRIESHRADRGGRRTSIGAPDQRCHETTVRSASAFDPDAPTDTITGAAGSRRRPRATHRGRLGANARRCVRS